MKCQVTVLPMVTMIAFHKFWIILFTSTTYSYLLQCPDISQRPFRAQAYCTSRLRSEYTCLYDTNRIIFSEQCNKNPDYVTRGEKYVITGRLRNVDCSSERYQPFPLWANVSGVCLFRKTPCEEEGQVVFNSGNLISDGACRCDFSKGYKFIQQPKQKCFCIPSDEDCSCHISQCDDGLNLSSDYECVGKEHHNDSNCPALEMKSGSWQPKIISRHYDGRIQKSFSKSDFYKIVVIGFVLCSISLLAIVIRGKVWKPEKYKMIIVLLLFGALLSCFVIAVEFVEHNLKTVAVGVSLLVACAVLGTVYVLYIFSTHQLVKPPIVYDEHYELQIYKLLKAASEGDMKQLKRIENEKYIDINDTDYDTRSALHLAACGGHIEAVKFLLNNNAGYFERNDRCLGHTPTEDAEWHMKRNDNNASTSNLNKVVILINKHKGFQKYKCSFKDLIVLKMMKAVDYGEVSVLRSLYSMGMDMNLSDPEGRTALHAAVERNQENVAFFLIDECKVSPFVRWRGQRPADLIKPQFCKQHIAQKLRDYMKQEYVVPEIRQEKYEDNDLKTVRIFNSALRGDIRQIKAYKAAGYDMTVSDYDKRTALHIAVNNNQELIVEYLLKECEMLKQQADTAYDRWKITPFKAANKEGKEHILKMFLEYCPNLPNPNTDEEKKEALLMASKYGYKERLKRYKKECFNMTISDCYRRTALHIAVYNNQDSCVRYLLDECGLTYEAELAVDSSGKTPYMAAKDNGSQSMVNIFMEYCPNLANTEKDGIDKLFLFMAGRNDDVNEFKRLYGDGGCMYMKNSVGSEVLHLAVNTWNIDVKKRIDETCAENENITGVDITCSKIINKNKYSH
ncbi:uncharacterized protein LOC143042939 [Mytilus galloprovincialis]|uniref:uncharacterized protein LOC143042939 n=1 Tax=Mytilus galloprovincialis TaxID=29158 RepID=UPI003F7C3E02